MPRDLTAEILDPAGATLGEGPAWDARSACLVWVDIMGRQVHLTEPDGARRTSYSFDRHIGAVLPAADGWLVVQRDRFLHLGTDGTQQPLLDVLADRPDLRFNDAKCDPHGRAFAGTMAYDESVTGHGQLFRLDPGPKVTAVHTGIALSNGIGWSPAHDRMYFIDTPTRVVTRFDYDVDTGTPTNPEPFIQVEGEGSPDGLCVDDEGCLWVARWGGSAVNRYTPDGRLDTVVHLPASRVTSCAFGPGGRLYITTASIGLDDAARAAQPLAGGLFVVEPGASAPPATPWRPL